MPRELLTWRCELLPWWREYPQRLYLHGPASSPLQVARGIYDAHATYRSWVSEDQQRALPPRSQVLTSMHHLEAVLESEGPFDGVMGISYGGLFAALIATAVD